MSESPDQWLEKLAIEEARRTFDNQIRLIEQTTSAAIEIVKLNFVVASVILGAVGISRGVVPEDIVLGVLPLLASATFAFVAYGDAVWTNPHYGMTIDLQKADQFDINSFSKKYEEMIGKNKSMLRREILFLVISILIFSCTLGFMSISFLSEFI